MLVGLLPATGNFSLLTNGCANAGISGSKYRRFLIRALILCDRQYRLFHRMKLATIRWSGKGVATLKPPRPRYDYVWDPAPIIAKLASIYPYDSCTLNVITKKLVLLLALGTDQRVQTLVLFKLSHMSLSEKLIIRIPDRIKTSALLSLFSVSYASEVMRIFVSLVYSSKKARMLSYQN